MSEGYKVVCIDNLSTGVLQNVAPFLAHEANFEYIDHNVSVHIDFPGELDEVYHFASAASPADFGRIPIEILIAGAQGTHNALGLARSRGGRSMLASTSEVYGDPLVHPQHEEYRGKVSTTGVRSVYDEAKRYAEALTMAYHRHHGVDTRIVRIFNTYGPKMREDDGRIVPNFMRQALLGKPITLYGDGTQTRRRRHPADEKRRDPPSQHRQPRRVLRARGRRDDYRTVELAERDLPPASPRRRSQTTLPRHNPTQRSSGVGAKDPGSRGPREDPRLVRVCGRGSIRGFARNSRRRLLKCGSL
ncbi:MAG TPA: NAD-dependent epimerase/dehydratase family protein [Rubrobacter sp.]|nr:NAD-dependent epimerase/dehydratase family protein [Rubrobacter sp.]